MKHITSCVRLDRSGQCGRKCMMLTTASISLLLALAQLVSAGAALTDSYSPEMAMDAWRLCGTSACTPEPRADWTCYGCKKHHPQMESVTVTTNATTAYLALTGYNPSSNLIVAAFRATHNDLNWVYNAMSELVPYAAACPNPNGTSDAACAKVHKGWLATWDSVRGPVLASTAALVQKYPDADGILITGYSLGGVISLQAALDLAAQHPDTAQVLYTFGQPRLGNAAFVDFATQTLQGGKQFRVTHRYDLAVRGKSREQGYLHTPHEIWYDNDGSAAWTNCSDSATTEDPNCSTGSTPKTQDEQWNDHFSYLGSYGVCGNPPLVPPGPNANSASSSGSDSTPSGTAPSARLAAVVATVIISLLLLF